MKLVALKHPNCFNSSASFFSYHPQQCLSYFSGLLGFLSFRCFSTLFFHSVKLRIGIFFMISCRSSSFNFYRLSRGCSWCHLLGEVDPAGISVYQQWLECFIILFKASPIFTVSSSNALFSSKVLSHVFPGCIHTKYPGESFH